MNLGTLDMARPTGERERFIALYEAHGGAVLAYARRRVGADEADDVLADTFVVAWRRLRDAPDPRLRDALAMLKPIDREALRLTAWEGLSAERAATAAGCSRATFDVRLHRARRRLADALPRIEEQS
ncbi:MAG TPA: sigma factor-like helix-turn-helix DNA-binding protein [Solirubrobacter sp.]|nr:sigma factor-like helix-turn-helix DNA-binding protein [Solirubrobacter sp.]